MNRATFADYRRVDHSSRGTGDYETGAVSSRGWREVRPSTDGATMSETMLRVRQGESLEVRGGGRLRVVEIRPTSVVVGYTPDEPGASLRHRKVPRFPRHFSDSEKSEK